MHGRSKLLAVVIAVLLSAFAALWVYLRGGSTVVTPDDAVERYRVESRAGSVRETVQEPRSGPATPPDGASLPLSTGETNEKAPFAPAEGIYVYRTTGSETIDALGGSTHRYPELTTRSVTRTACGFSERWTALDERWEERETCRSANYMSLIRITTFHQFFRQSEQLTFLCESQRHTTHPHLGSRWRIQCASEKSNVVSRFTVRGLEAVEVGQSSVQTLRLHIESTLTGRNEGLATADIWQVPDTGLIVKESSTTRIRSRRAVVGETNYRETYSLLLSSMDPRK